jgi:glutaminyl-tRNA synthetase
MALMVASVPLFTSRNNSIEGITHSICTLEFENHRPLYDWFLDALKVYHPQQIEFARLNLSYTVMSKRKLLQLVQEGFVRGWDDPRMPTISGLRRRGYTPEAIHDFIRRVGVAEQEMPPRPLRAVLPRAGEDGNELPCTRGNSA